jgi:hypothetical protein
MRDGTIKRNNTHLATIDILRPDFFADLLSEVAGGILATVMSPSYTSDDVGENTLLIAPATR